MMKLSFCIIIFLLSGNALFAQVAVNADGSAPDSSAMLDVKSAGKGFLLPRMTHAELNTIIDPADGLLVYCTDCGLNGLGTLSMHLAGSWFTINANCLNPLLPVTGTHEPSAVQIVWKWNPATGASGYRWNTTDDYGAATDMGADTAKTETGLTPDSLYTRFVWAYNTCGTSASATLTSATLP